MIRGATEKEFTSPPVISIKGGENGFDSHNEMKNKNKNNHKQLGQSEISSCWLFNTSCGAAQCSELWDGM